VGEADDSDIGGKADEDFLDRWSRRKLADRNGEVVADSLPASTAAGVLDHATVAAVDEESGQELTDADMPPIDSLDKDSDFSMFMSPGVSDQLRTLALRKLFHLPAFNVTDGLNDYDEDYTRFAGLGNVVTQEMKRMLRRELEANVAQEDEESADTEVPPKPADADLTEHTDDDNA
jgi:hypothetical protein